MEIRQFRVVIRARFFERTCRFYGESLAFPRLQSWEREDGRGALFQAGSGVIEVLGAAEEDPRVRNESYDAQGPLTKVTMTVVVPSAQQAYQEMLFRDKNIPGGLRKAEDGGGLIFETHDPEGVRLHFREG